jgi:hypothetical protein
VAKNRAWGLDRKDYLVSKCCQEKCEVADQETLPSQKDPELSMMLITKIIAAQRSHTSKRSLGSLQCFPIFSE